MLCTGSHSAEDKEVTALCCCFSPPLIRWTTLRHVTLPLASPGIVAGSILVFIPALGAFIAPDLLGGGKKLMLGSLVQLQFSAARDWPFGSALTMVIMSVVLICLLLFAVNQRRNEGGFQH